MIALTLRTNRHSDVVAAIGALQGVFVCPCHVMPLAALFTLWSPTFEYLMRRYVFLMPLIARQAAMDF
jgi:hypothetical protein